MTWDLKKRNIETIISFLEPLMLRDRIIAQAIKY